MWAESLDGPSHRLLKSALRAEPNDALVEIVDLARLDMVDRMFPALDMSCINTPRAMKRITSMGCTPNPAVKMRSLICFNVELPLAHQLVSTLSDCEILLQHVEQHGRDPGPYNP